MRKKKAYKDGGSVGSAKKSGNVYSVQVPKKETKMASIRRPKPRG